MIVSAVASPSCALATGTLVAASPAAPAPTARRRRRLNRAISALAKALAMRWVSSCEIITPTSSGHVGERTVSPLPGRIAGGPPLAISLPPRVQDLAQTDE